MSAPTGYPWHNLPTELKLSIVDALDLSDAKSLSRVDSKSYQLCVPATFKIVKLRNFSQLLRFHDHVPLDYYRHILELDLCTLTEDTDLHHTHQMRTDAIIALLVSCPRLTKLMLRLHNSLDKSVIAPFAHLSDLRHLTLANCADEADCPLSERLVVAIAATVPNLEQLSLDKISRSKLHAHDLEGSYPFVPVVIGDDDIPDHPKLGSELSLPSLLSIPTLRRLVIRETHLGDPRWATTPVACKLEFLDLGSCSYQSEDYNRLCTERIMAAVGRTVDEFSLTTSVSDASFSRPGVTPLPRLRKLHISPFFPVDSVVETMSNLAGSPIETVSMQCYEDDVIDVCSALEEFLSLRVERGPEFYQKLKRIDVNVAAVGVDYGFGYGYGGGSGGSGSGDGGFECDDDDKARLCATRKLQEFCSDLKLSSAVAKAPCDAGDVLAFPCVVPHPAHGYGGENKEEERPTRTEEWTSC